jgi:hypothetical protein
MLVKVKLYNQIMDLRSSTAECILQYDASFNEKRFWLEANSSDAHRNKEPSGLGEECSPLCQYLDRTY